MTKDPVFGMEGKPSISASYGGKRYHFCSEDCMRTFNKDPKRFAK